MKTVGIICEYNPFHRGHEKQLNSIRQQFGQDTVIVCLMSGNYVQRGAPAIFDKSLRAKAAADAGADLVLEMPVGISLSSAEGFARGSVEILSRCCDVLCFGTESLSEEQLWHIAVTMLQPAFRAELRSQLETGCSFPVARDRALHALGIVDEGLHLPNNTLALEYVKAILETSSSMSVFPIHRDGDYHSDELNADHPSASAVRANILNTSSWEFAVPNPSLYNNASVHTLKAGERAVLAKLRTMEDEDFEALPYGTEGLWRKLMHASRSKSTLEEIASAVKSKRYTRTRIDRMILCAFLGLTAKEIGIVPPYVRILAFSNRGRSLLSTLNCGFVNTGRKMNDPYQKIEQRCGSLYGLFCTDLIETPCVEDKRRIIYLQENIQ